MATGIDKTKLRELAQEAHELWIAIDRTDDRVAIKECFGEIAEKTLFAAMRGPGVVS